MPTFEQASPVLSPQFAREHPEQYRRELERELGEKTALGGQILSALYLRKELDASSIHVVDGWVSRTTMRNDGVASISLGVDELPTDIRRSIIFGHPKSAEGTGVVYRFSHELSHLVAGNPKDHDIFPRLYTQLIAMRHAGFGLSSLGNLAMYRSMGAKEQAKEDLVELVNMHVNDPQYLEAYVRYLSAAEFAQSRGSQNLVTLSAKAASVLHEQIRSGVTRFLQE